jgi:hypothetical protein
MAEVKTQPAPAGASTPKSRFLRFEDSIAGHQHSYAPGDVVEYGPEWSGEADRLIERGIAEEVTVDGAKEYLVRTGRPAVRKHRPYVAPPETAERERPAEQMTQRGGKIPAKVKVSDEDFPS